jgi:hypothetical protein
MSFPTILGLKAERLCLSNSQNSLEPNQQNLRLPTRIIWPTMYSLPISKTMAQPQKLSGMKQFNNANAHKAFMDLSASNAHLQENGTMLQTHAIAQHR